MPSTVSEVGYTFLKTTSTPYNVEGYGLLNDCKVYKLYANNSMVGQFFLHRKVCFISYDETNLKVKIKRYFFKKSDYSIVDRTTGSKIGGYYLPNWVGGGLGKVGSISLGYETYDCEMVLPDIRASLFDKSTWGYHKMILANDITSVVYHCQEGKGTDAFAKKEMLPLMGNITGCNAELLLILSGFYMLEEGMMNEDRAGVY